MTQKSKSPMLSASKTYGSPSSSSIRQPSGMIGRTALRILLEECEDAELIPRQTVFQPELVMRRSTAAR